MAYQPSTLEAHAAEAAAEAFDHMHKAESLLGIAEKALVEEERKHAPAVSIGNQHKIARFTDVMNVLARIREGTFSADG